MSTDDIESVVQAFIDKVKNNIKLNHNIVDSDTKCLGSDTQHSSSESASIKIRNYQLAIESLVTQEALDTRHMVRYQLLKRMQEANHDPQTNLAQQASQDPPQRTDSNS